MSEDTKTTPEGNGVVEGEGEIPNAADNKAFEEKIEKAMEEIVAAETPADVPKPPTPKQSTPVKQPTPVQQPKRQAAPVKPPKKKHTGAKITGTLFGLVILGAAGAYLGMSYYYTNKFFPGTVINSFEVGDMTVEQCEELIRNKVEDYSLTVSSRDYDPETISAKSIGYKYKSDGAVEKALEKQNPLKWITGYLMPQEYSVGENIAYSKKKVKKELEKLVCMKSENQVLPEDAYITFEGNLFTIVAGSEGSAVDENKALEVIDAAIDKTQSEVDLDKSGAYKEPNVREDDSSLVERLKIVNTYAKASITHVFGDTTEVLDSTTFKDWYSTDANGALYLDGEVLKQHLVQYVADMAANHDTLGATRTFTATSGRTVEVSGGNYGWQIAQSDEVQKMYEEILGGETVSREPIYSSYGKSWTNGSDIGNTYIEVDISKQHMFFYQDGAVIFESDFVSGNTSYSDRATPSGVCHIVYKTKDFTLRGEKKADGTYEYEEPVSYWMPFNGGVGFHDAPWRSEFGGEIYKTSGSHGCINMPSAKAADLYGLIDESVPIVVFY